ncbi:probable ubiquitin carboxyl-terminal hydrolase MINDY-4 isoform X2 [Thalassophryne amazonica]|uniref:probable ubiquitin carboxyl-terminal hydrolase MINDY-4 isoform X2 n=1 Tax=Thalassophryne amazonica TaxID=390379 RepID=UPI001470E01B|nr:probable ubiquitin carboxyl-terminal hydrolase MINDY-4 isoform X2 [Thalassophryne amazonica]
MSVSVEEVSSSLVREYLSRKGLKRTICCMDEEHPRTEASINNRSQLRQILHMDSLYRNNKAQKSSLKTLLEIIVKHHIESHKNGMISCSESEASQSAPNAVVSARIGDSGTDDKTKGFDYKPFNIRSHTEETSPSQPSLLLAETNRLPTFNQMGSWSYNLENKKPEPVMDVPKINESFPLSEMEKRITLAESSQKNRNHCMRRGMMAGPTAHTPQESNKIRQTRRMDTHQPLFSKEEEFRQSRRMQQKCLETDVPRLMCPADYVGDQQKLESVSDILKPRKDLNEMVLDDVDADELQELSRVSFQRVMTKEKYASCPMDLHTAMKLKIILLGSSLSCFNLEWRNQGFAFSETHELRYGIVQKKGGPCGVLASIQAFILKKLLFENVESSNTGLQRLRPSNTARRKCLILAMAEILWRAGDQKQATVAINSGKNHFFPAGHYKSEGVFEKIISFTVDNIEDLQFILELHIEQFESGMLACILLSISAILSRSVEKVREDMDVPSSTLIGAHGYCTQELVNLLLCGRAVSNVFDNDVELDSGKGNKTLLKGIKDQCDIGLLSLFEHYNICKEHS